MRTVTQYEAKDGRVFDSREHCRRHEAKIDGLLHECPKCKTTGVMQGKPIEGMEYDEVAQAFGGSAYRKVVVGHESVACDLCSGRGWTKTPKVPITRTEVIGYA